MDEQALGGEIGQSGAIGESLGEQSPMGGVMPEAKTYTPKTIPPISPAIGKKVSKTAKDFLGSRLTSDTKKEVLDTLGKKIVEALKQSAERRAKKDEAIREYKKALYLKEPEGTSPLGEDGANIRTPLTWKIFNALHAFYLEACTGIRPYIKTEPAFGGDITIANKIEGHYDGLYDEQIRFVSKMDTALTLALSDGTAFLHPKWDRRVRKISSTGIVTPETAAMFGLSIGTTGAYESKTKELYSPGEVFQGTVEAVERDSGDIEVISYFDFFMSPASASHPELATIYGARKFKTIDTLRYEVRSGLLDPSQLELMEDSSGLRPINDLHQTNLLLGSRLTSDNGDEDSLDSDMQENNVIGVSSQRVVEVFEGCVRFDGDGDDLDETWTVTVELSTGTILKMQEYYSGDVCAFQPLTLFDRPGKCYGMPLPQILDGMQSESDLTANLILDAAILANTLIVEEGEGVRSPLDTEDLQVGLNKFSVNAKAGEGFAVHSLAPNVQSGLFPARDVVEAMASDATAASETLVGRVSDKSGTTAFETNQALVAGARRLKVGVDRVREAVWKTHVGLHNICLQHYALKSGGDPNYRIPYPSRQGAKVTKMDITLEEFVSPVRFFVLGDGINTDKALQLQAAEKLYLMAERSPFISSKMERLYSVTASFLSAFNKKDYLNFIGSIDEARQMDQEAEQKAAQPLNSLVDLADNAKPENVAMMLVKADPGAAQQYLQMLAAVYGAEATAKAEADAQTQDGQAEAEKQAMELQMQSLDLQAQQELQKIQLQRQQDKLAYDAAVGKLKLEEMLREEEYKAKVAILASEKKREVADAKESAKAASKPSDSKTKGK